MGMLGTVIDAYSGKLARKRKGLEIVGKLEELGIDDPATINKTVDNYVQTGMLVLPTTQESRVNMGDGSVQQKGRTTISDLGTTEVSTVPIKLGKKFGVYNEETGEGSMVPSLQGAGQVLPVRAPNPNRSGMIYAYTADKEGGIQVINARPTDGPDRWVRVDTKPANGSGSRGGGGTSLQDRIDAATIANFQRHNASATQKGEPVSQDLLEQAVQAAQRQGLPVYEKTVDQPVAGLWGGVSRILPGGDTGMEQVNTLGIGNPPGTPVLSAPPAPAPAAMRPGPGQAAVPRFQRNARTGERRVSYDNGLTWHPAR